MLRRHSNINVTEYRILLKIVRDKEYQEPSIRDRLPGEINLRKHMYKAKKTTRPFCGDSLSLNPRVSS